MNREIPIITDDLAQPEFGTGAVKVTPAHDPNDFEAGLRHNLPQIEVIDEHSKMNANAGPYAGPRRFAARARVVEDLREQGFLVGSEGLHALALGKCDRCGTIVEPRLSTQWFVKIKPLAEKAIAAVETDEITFVPDNYAKMYLELDEQHPRLVHLAPALVGTSHPGVALLRCGEMTVARETPAKCPKCGNAQLEQDTDVLDTWFSSGLLPFTTLGWPERRATRRRSIRPRCSSPASTFSSSGWRA